MGINGSAHFPAAGVALVDRDEASTVVWLRGQHDLSTVERAREAVASAMSFDASDLVIDLSGVDFMSAATVGVIVQTRELLRAQGRNLRLRHPSASARRVVDICGLVDLLDPGPSADHLEGTLGNRLDLSVVAFGAGGRPMIGDPGPPVGGLAGAAW